MCKIYDSRPDYPPEYDYDEYDWTPEDDSEYIKQQDADADAYFKQMEHEKSLVAQWENLKWFESLGK